MPRGIRFDDGNSLVVFGTTAKLVGDEKEYQSRVRHTMGFEAQERIDVQRTGPWRLVRMMSLLGIETLAGR